jgi:hypothetical protein
VPTVRATPRAAQQVEALNRRDADAFRAFVLDLGRQGCAALAYRLSGQTPIDHVCVKHLRADLRVTVVFESIDVAWILLVGRHVDDDPTLDVYAELYRVLGQEPEADAGRTKPPCSDEVEKLPPVLGDLADAILASATQVRRTRRRR